jgi:hypothetical protein
MQVTLTPHAQELLRAALDRHPGQAPAEILEQALSERVQRELAALPSQPKRTQAEFHTWLDQFTAFSGKLSRMPGETFSRAMIYRDTD